MIEMTNNYLAEVNGKAKYNLESKLSLVDLDARLQEDKKNGFVRGEQWFRNESIWYELVFSYNNPYNNRKVNSELYLLHEKRSKLASLIGNSTLLFYGVGVGETEIEIIDWELEGVKYAEIVAIDVNEKFVRKFVNGL